MLMFTIETHTRVKLIFEILRKEDPQIIIMSNRCYFCIEIIEVLELVVVL